MMMHGLANFKFIKTGLILYVVLHNPSLSILPFMFLSHLPTFLVYFDLEICYTFRRTTQKFKPFCITKACKIIFTYLQKIFRKNLLLPNSLLKACPSTLKMEAQQDFPNWTTHSSVVETEEANLSEMLVLVFLSVVWCHISEDSLFQLT